MKKILFVLVTMVMSLFSCTDQQFVDELAGGKAELSTANEFNALVEQARLGDGQAFLKLADCYRDGKGVEKDFFGMLSMVAQAEEFGGIRKMEDYMKKMPESSAYRMTFEAVEKLMNEQVEEAKMMSEQLISKGVPDGYFVQGLITIESGDTLGGLRMMELVASQGSNLGDLMLCIPAFHRGKAPDTVKLTELAEKMPMVNIILAELYLGNNDVNMYDDRMAAHYYLKADEHACLNRRGARWLLGYYEAGKLHLSERDVTRLKILSGEQVVKETPVQCQDEALEASVSQILQDKMTERNCSKGIVYIVETVTGAIKAHVSLASKGKNFVPCEDAYNDEQSVMVTGPTYLALLSSGRFSSDDVIDTGCGIYKDVKDHNWRRGGYGQLTLEQALGYRSQVAFTKANEVAFGNNRAQLDSQVATYLADMPNSTMGMLTFYNAVANGGRMVQLVTEGNDVIVLNDLIAEPQYIEALQKGLQRAVSQGMFRRAGREYTTVAACGRTFLTKGNSRRMELCGYFPADKPLYTIMVILEKDGLPASSSGMCGPIMASTIDVLVDSYGLQPMLVREYEEQEEIIEEVDTVAAR